MSIPKHIRIKNKTLPNKPGVYFMKNARGVVLYVGMATSLKTRVSSYFTGAHDNKTALLVSNIKKIDYQITDSVLEARFLEPDLIHRYQPKYNIDLKDDKTFVYIAITKEEFPKVLTIRGRELEKLGKKVFKGVFGPFVSNALAASLLKVLHRIFPYSNCSPPKKNKEGKPCFYYHIGQCMGVCTGEVSKQEYDRIIQNILLFFRGRKKRVLNNLKKQMNELAKEEKFELAAHLRNQIFNLEHIQDTHLLTEGKKLPTGFTRIEGYDISNIGGASATGSMVVFENAEANKSEYRKFKIKTVEGPNDVAMLGEVIMRRFKNPWMYPDLILVDGGIAQVNRTVKILKEFRLDIPIVGMAKGSERKNTRLVYGPMSEKIKRRILKNKLVLVTLRDEAHRFAVQYHRKLRGKH